MNNKSLIMIILSIFLIGAVTAISGCTNSGASSDQPKINVSNVKAVKGSFGMYDVSGQIIPNEDISYLEVAAIWYDASGAVIQTSPMIWNVNDAKKGQVYKFKGSDSLYEKGTPTKVQVLVFDSPFNGGDDSGAMYRQNVSLKK